MEIRYQDQARQEGIDAADWYEERSAELRLRFLEKWKGAEKRLASVARMDHRRKNKVGRCRFEVFPYTLVYRPLGEDVLEVVAVVHASRRPGYWRDRIRKD